MRLPSADYRYDGEASRSPLPIDNTHIPTVPSMPYARRPSHARKTTENNYYEKKNA